MSKDDVSIDKLLFDLGWDYFTYRQGLPDEANNYPKFMEGYEAAKQRVTHTRRGDRFELKVLQVKFNALKRNRVFDETLTPDLLRGIDIPVCPITLTKLTYSSGEDSNWSVDRINNDVGYTMGNLVIVSSRANKAKGTMSVHDIESAAWGTEEVNGLKPHEWGRWLAICATSITSKSEDNEIHFQYKCVPHVVDTPPMLRMNPAALLQIAIANRINGDRSEQFYSKLTGGLPKWMRKELNGICNDAAKLSRTIVYHENDIWYNRSIFKRFILFFDGLNREERIMLQKNMMRSNQCGKAPIEQQAWDPESRGYHKKPARKP